MVTEKVKWTHHIQQQNYSWFRELNVIYTIHIGKKKY